MKQGWKMKCEEPFASVVNIIQEFFSNAKEAMWNRFYIRGKFVLFDSHAQNCLCKLRDFEFDEYASFYLLPYHLKELLRFCIGLQVAKWGYVK